MDIAAPRLIDLPEVIRITSIRKSSVYERISSGEFRPIKIGRKTCFCEAEIFAWVNERRAARKSVKGD
jgi:predicted DNA-binding transcriptional regulator AlpA